MFNEEAMEELFEKDSNINKLESMDVFDIIFSS